MIAFVVVEFVVVATVVVVVFVVVLLVSSMVQDQWSPQIAVVDNTVVCMWLYQLILHLPLMCYTAVQPQPLLFAAGCTGRT